MGGEVLSVGFAPSLRKPAHLPEEGPRDGDRLLPAPGTLLTNGGAEHPFVCKTQTSLWSLLLSCYLPEVP